MSINIKLTDAIINSWIWENYQYRSAFLDLLILAKNPSPIKINGKLMPVDIGTVITSSLILKKRWSWSRDKIDKFLVSLMRDNIIELRTSPRGTMIFFYSYQNYCR